MSASKSRFFPGLFHLSKFKISIEMGNEELFEVKSLIVISSCFVFTIFGVVVCHELWEIALWAPVVVFVIFIFTNYYVGLKVS